ncbi:hypothetical protein FRC0195_00440 [Corynebacterium diphtheriae]|nr:hypothetical protein FRC0195_00440 [Corynebacterium diphtheriae]
MLLNAVNALNQDLLGLRESLNDLTLSALVRAGDHENHIALVDLHN